MCCIIEKIQGKLKEIEEKEHVKILLAVESGSRAWGIESPDSDYDVRFVYVRPQEEYLRLDEFKDVIEWQLDEVMDINGWDLKKALRQFHRGNATLFEWSNSPVVYKETKDWRGIYQVSQTCFSIKASAYHYYGTAKSTYNQYLQEDSVNYKKYFYALRPLLAGRYIQKYLCPPPVLFKELMKLDMPVEVHEKISELMELKRKNGESASGERISIIQRFIEDELEKQKEYVDGMADDRKEDWDSLNKIFLETVNGK